ncbi:HAD-IA family hydrolase [Hephaestia mangrovi]|uniref:HAD-IA family hydrolase n=1 Tax=Hephaestia mangrovi TaxID=2873268 RepID=UPI001CA63273|nr:HAD-IA family hydrolase [Hephaestia mangrovi]MBY8827734.1 HAD-IA family hydrolase [Hephaestia mangrovi]
MPDFPFDLVGFDLDGTLADSSADLAAAVNHVLASLGAPPLAVAQVRRNIGGGGRRMLARSLADSGMTAPNPLDSLYDRMIDYYTVHIADETRPYPGVTDTLAMLSEAGVELAVVTNKSEQLAARLLDALGLADRFATVIGGDSVAKGKPAPDPLIEMLRRCAAGRAAFVGDSEFDIAAAKAASLPCVAVSYGYPGKPVAELGADAVIDDFAALPEALCAIAVQTGR